MTTPAEGHRLDRCQRRHPQPDGQVGRAGADTLLNEGEQV